MMTSWKPRGQLTESFDHAGSHPNDVSCRSGRGHQHRRSWRPRQRRGVGPAQPAVCVFDDAGLPTRSSWSGEVEQDDDGGIDSIGDAVRISSTSSTASWRSQER